MFNQLQEYHVIHFLQIKCKHLTERESMDQILEIEPYRIKSIKIQHQHKFNSTNQIYLKILCEQ